MSSRRWITKPASQRCHECSGTGWKPAWQLLTYHRGEDWCYVDRTTITDPQAATRLRASVNDRDQCLYEGVIRCLSCERGRTLAATSRGEVAA